ncbi:MAG: hypothetical protein KC933_29845 [Myxococcales bacterium]|nr:hypothetical protein [Myxococcales bacterium]MCB9651053.1 hypothetical protein [Deltaproteobacteria bacterium]
MSEDDQKKVSPLWHFMRTMAPTPPPARATAADELPPREITEQDLLPLREDVEWRPAYILEALGPAEKEADFLGNLLVACAVIQGPHRLYEMTERLRHMMTAFVVRIRAMRGDDALASRRADLDMLVKRLNSGIKELVNTRARAANDMDSDVLRPDGLRVLDLRVLTSQITTSVEAQEVVRRRNVAGIDYGIAVARRAPDMAYAEDWLDRALGNARLNGILLYWPPAYGRVVVVYEDGRLAYDPGASLDDG